LEALCGFCKEFPMMCLVLKKVRHAKCVVVYFGLQGPRHLAMIADHSVGTFQHQQGKFRIC
jgi:hypothetical protein